MKLMVLSISVFLNAAFTQAAQMQTGPYLIRGAQTSSIEFLAALKLEGDAKSFSQYQLENLSSPSLSQNLKSEFAEAQSRYLEGTGLSNQDDWYNVTTYATKSHWSREERQMIVVAFLRLAQLTDDSAKTRDWLARAIGFDPHYQPDPQIFPPPLLALYSQIKRKLEPVNIPTSHFKNFQFAVVNGQNFDLAKFRTIPWPQTVVRLTLVSEMYKKVELIVETNEIARLQPNREPLLSGSCETPTLPNLEASARAVQVKGVFAGPCIGGAATNIQSTNISTNQVSRPLNNFGVTSDYSRISPESAFTSPTKNSESHFYQKSWFWTSAAVLAGVLLITRDKEESSGGSTPTHKEGY